MLFAFDEIILNFLAFRYIRKDGIDTRYFTPDVAGGGDARIYPADITAFCKNAQLTFEGTTLQNIRLIPDKLYAVFFQHHFEKQSGILMNFLLGVAEDTFAGLGDLDKLFFFQIDGKEYLVSVFKQQQQVVIGTAERFDLLAQPRQFLVYVVNIPFH